MTKRRFKEEQIIKILNEKQSGRKVQDLCREYCCYQDNRHGRRCATCYPE